MYELTKHFINILLSKIIGITEAYVLVWHDNIHIYIHILDRLDTLALVAHWVLISFTQWMHNDIFSQNMSASKLRCHVCDSSYTLISDHHKKKKSK